VGSIVEKSIFFSPSIINEISIKNYIEMLWINKIYLILLISIYQEFEPKMEDRIRILKNHLQQKWVIS